MPYRGGFYFAHIEYRFVNMHTGCVRIEVVLGGCRWLVPHKSGECCPNMHVGEISQFCLGALMGTIKYVIPTYGPVAPTIDLIDFVHKEGMLFDKKSKIFQYCLEKSQFIKFLLLENSNFPTLSKNSKIFFELRAFKILRSASFGNRLHMPGLRVTAPCLGASPTFLGRSQCAYEEIEFIFSLFLSMFCFHKTWAHI